MATRPCGQKPSRLLWVRWLTLDADLGVAQQVTADPAVLAGLEGLEYERPESANRFIRQSAQGRRRVIDVLMPSYASRMKTSQRAGEMTLDAIPGLNLALSAPGESLEVAAQLPNGTVIEFVTVVRTSWPRYV